MKHKVLIVEDQPDLRKLIRMTLEFGEYDIHEASDGERGLLLVRLLRPRVLILDVMMPGNLDGFQVCRKVKDDPLLREVIVIMLTARGQLEDINRVDTQIKLHGFRVEPGEIEAMLREHPGVADAVVLLDGADTLAGYLVCDAEPPAAAELRAHLGTRLPSYMVPSVLRVVDRFPLTGNGKVDRNALRARGGAQPAAPRAEPSTPTGRLLAEVFAEVLDCPPPGRS